MGELLHLDRALLRDGGSRPGGSGALARAARIVDLLGELVGVIAVRDVEVDDLSRGLVAGVAGLRRRVPWRETGSLMVVSRIILWGHELQLVAVIVEWRGLLAPLLN